VFAPLNGVLQPIVTAFQNTWSKLGKVFEPLKGMVQPLAAMFNDAWSKLKQALEPLKGIFEPLISMFKDIGNTELGKWFKNLFSQKSGGIAGITAGISTATGGAAGSSGVLASLGTMASSMNPYIQAGMMAFDAIKGIMGDMKTAQKEQEAIQYDKFIRTANSGELAGKVKELSGQQGTTEQARDEAAKRKAAMKWYDVALDNIKYAFGAGVKKKAETTQADLDKLNSDLAKAKEKLQEIIGTSKEELISVTLGAINTDSLDEYNKNFEKSFTDTIRKAVVNGMPDKKIKIEVDGKTAEESISGLSEQYAAVLAEAMANDTLSDDEYKKLNEIEAKAKKVSDILREGITKFITILKDSLVKVEDIAGEIKGAFASDTISKFKESLTKGIWKSVRDGLVKGFMEGTILKPLMDKLVTGINTAIADGMLTEEEKSSLKPIIGEINDKASTFYDALNAMGLTVDSVSEKLSNSILNAPEGFKIEKFRYEAQSPTNVVEIQQTLSDNRVYTINVTGATDPTAVAKIVTDTIQKTNLINGGNAYSGIPTF